MIFKSVSALVIASLVTVSTVFSYGTVQRASAQTNMQNSFINQAFYSRATQLRFLLNNLLKEHTVMAAEDLTSYYKGEDTTRLDQLMMENQNQLANLVQQGYGTNKRNSFVRLWSNHMQEYKNYADARKNNDTIGMNTARGHLMTISSNLGNLFASPHLSAGTVTMLMNQHVNGTLALIDAVANNDLTQKANLMKQGYDQAGKFADTLARGVILDKTSF